MATSVRGSASLCPFAGCYNFGKKKARQFHAWSTSGDAKDINYKKTVEAQLSEDPVASEAFARIDAAAEKVAKIQEEQMRLEIEIMQAETQQRLRDVDVQATQKPEVLAAEAEVAAALKQLQEADAETLAIQKEKATLQSVLIKNSERAESAKAAIAAACGGAFGVVPLVLTESSSWIDKGLTVSASVATCFLFGVVYRYVVAADSENLQLKSGVVAAFGLARGLALAESSLKGAESVTVDRVAGAALAMGQSMLVIGFAVVALEYAMKDGRVKRFGQTEDL